MIKIALFGGSFNPPTHSHTTVASEVLRLRLVDEVWFVPSANHPFKDTQARKATLQPFADRCLMLELASSFCPRMKVEGVEDREGLSGYTADTVRALQAAHPDHHFHWVLGTDCVGEFGKWSHVDWLLDNVTFIVFPRVGYPPDTTSPYWGRLQADHVVLEEHMVKLVAGSSTAARANPDGGLLHPGVAAYWKRLTDSRSVGS